jgi:hypothetical protein
MLRFKQYINEAKSEPHYTDERGNKYHYGSSGYVSVTNKSGIDQGLQHISNMSDVHKKNYEKVHGMSASKTNEEVRQDVGPDVEAKRKHRLSSLMTPGDRLSEPDNVTKIRHHLLKQPETKKATQDILKTTIKDRLGKSDLYSKSIHAKKSRLPEEIEHDVTEGLDEASAAWQRKEGKNPSGGLNRKGIASYRRENPGSKLSMAVTTKPSKLKKGSKAWNRRKSFCARMGGMPGPMKDEKGRPTRKALSLRKWNC